MKGMSDTLNNMIVKSNYSSTIWHAIHNAYPIYFLIGLGHFTLQWVRQGMIIKATIPLMLKWAFKIKWHHRIKNKTGTSIYTLNYIIDTLLTQRNVSIELK